MGQEHNRLAPRKGYYKGSSRATGARQEDMENICTWTKNLRIMKVLIKKTYLTHNGYNNVYDYIHNKNSNTAQVRIKQCFYIKYHINKHKQYFQNLSFY